MKTFLISLVILCSIVGFVIWNAWDLNKTINEMLALTDALPIEATEFSRDEKTEETISALWQLWERKFYRIAFTGGYSNCNRADEAIVALFIHYQNGNAEDFTHARLLFWDSLRRLKKLESFHI